ncbi:hypothetical protein BA78_8775 [Aspergillus fumigatus]|nr:hypothetical protein BA78_8775 [Aspergillus fumigatus]
MEHTVVETKHIDERGDTSVSNGDSNSTAVTRHSGLSSVSLSDQSTIVEDANALEEPELFAVHSPYVDDSTGEQMVRLYYELPALNLVFQSLTMIQLRPAFVIEERIFGYLFVILMPKLEWF